LGVEAHFQMDFPTAQVTALIGLIGHQSKLGNALMRKTMNHLRQDGQGRFSEASGRI
jgi:hypothetical protein